MGSLIQIRRDSSSNWTTANVVLSSGELAYETNTRKIKVGDGQTDWANVGYFPGNIVTPTVTTTTAVSPFGAGFANMVVLTSGLSWTIPEAMRVDGAKWKVTLVGGGGGGGQRPCAYQLFY